MNANRMGVYSITSVATGDAYIGSSVRVDNRWEGHRHDLNAGRHHNAPLQHDWRRYGEASFAFKFLQEVEHPDELQGAEQRWMDNVRPAYNLKPRAGGRTSMRPQAASPSPAVATAYRAHQFGKVIRCQGRRTSWMADQLHLPKRTIRRVIRGHATLSYEEARLAAMILGSPLDYLFEPVASTL